jgi:hypothetical protein
MKAIPSLALKSIINLSLCLIALTLASCSSTPARSIAGYDVETPQSENAGHIPATGSGRFERNNQY